MTRWSSLACLSSAAFLCASSLGCSAEDDPEPLCTDQAAFELTVHSLKGPLPADTRLEVKYNGGTEVYRLDASNDELEILLCKASPSGDAGLPVDLLRCKVWSQSVAVVTVTATGFSSIQRELTAKKTGKCFATVPIDLVLGESDAGP